MDQVKKAEEKARKANERQERESVEKATSKKAPDVSDDVFEGFPQSQIPSPLPTPEDLGGKSEAEGEKKQQDATVNEAEEKKKMLQDAVMQAILNFTSEYGRQPKPSVVDEEKRKREEEQQKQQKQQDEVMLVIADFLSKHGGDLKLGVVEGVEVKKEVDEQEEKPSLSPSEKELDRIRLMLSTLAKANEKATPEKTIIDLSDDDDEMEIDKPSLPSTANRIRSPTKNVPKQAPVIIDLVSSDDEMEDFDHSKNDDDHPMNDDDHANNGIPIGHIFPDELTINGLSRESIDAFKNHKLTYEVQKWAEKRFRSVPTALDIERDLVDTIEQRNPRPSKEYLCAARHVKNEAVLFFKLAVIFEVHAAMNQGSCAHMISISRRARPARVDGYSFVCDESSHKHNRPQRQYGFANFLYYGVQSHLGRLGLTEIAWMMENRTLSHLCGTHNCIVVSDHFVEYRDNNARRVGCHRKGANREFYSPMSQTLLIQTRTVLSYSKLPSKKAR